MARKAAVSPVDQSNCDCCSCAKKKRNGQCRLVMVAASNGNKVGKLKNEVAEVQGRRRGTSDTKKGRIT